MSVNCVYCGHVNPDGTTVCQSCGRTLPPPPSSGAGSYGEQPWGSPTTGREGGYVQPGGSYPPPSDPYPGGYQPGASSYGQGGGYGGQQAGYGEYGQPGSSFGQPPGSWGAAPGGAMAGFGSPDVAQAQKNANIAMILSIVSIPTVFCCLGVVFAIVGVVMGGKAKSTLQQFGVQEGQTQATVAVVLGWVAIGLTILSVIVNILMALAS